MNKLINKKIKILKLFGIITAVAGLLLGGTPQASAKLIFPDEDYYGTGPVTYPGNPIPTVPATSCNSKKLEGFINVTTTVNTTVYGWFEWSNSPGYQWENGSYPNVVIYKTPKQSFSVNRNTGRVDFNYTITGLSEKTTYYYRVVGQARGQTPKYDTIFDFTTPACAVKNYNVKATAGVGGWVDPTSQTVKEGERAIVNVYKNEGYNIASVSGCGNGTLNSSTYTTDKVMADCEVTAMFSVIPIPTYTINATAGAGGKINPSGMITKNRGSDQTFYITPDDGYNIANVLVDNVPFGAITTYTFQNITADHIIHANFAKIPPPVAKKLIVNLIAYGATELNPGESTTLHWSSENAKSCTGSMFNTQGYTSGFQTTGPLYTTTTYGVTCTAVDANTTPASDTKYLTITVKPKQPELPKGYVDLVPYSMDFYPENASYPGNVKEGDNVTVAFKIKNQGTAAAGRFTMIITAKDPYGNDAMKCTWQIPANTSTSLTSLAPGEIFSRGYPGDYGSKCYGYAADTTQPVPFGIMNAKAGTYNLTFVVDENNMVTESDGNRSYEGNNTMFKSLAVSQRTSNRSLSAYSTSGLTHTGYGGTNYNTPAVNYTYTAPTSYNTYASKFSTPSYPTYSAPRSYSFPSYNTSSYNNTSIYTPTVKYNAPVRSNFDTPPVVKYVPVNNYTTSYNNMWGNTTNAPVNNAYTGNTSPRNAPRTFLRR